MSDTSPTEDFRAQVQRLVAEGKLTPEEAQGLLETTEEDPGTDLPGTDPTLTTDACAGPDGRNLHLEVGGYTLQVLHDPAVSAPQLNANRPEELLLERTHDGWKVSRAPGHKLLGWSDLRAILTVPFQPRDVRGAIGGGSLNLPDISGNAALKIGGGSVALQGADTLTVSIGGGSLKAGRIHGATQITIGGGSARIDHGRDLHASVAGGSLSWQGQLTQGNHSVNVAGGSARLDLEGGSHVTLHGQSTAGSLKAAFPVTRTGQYATHQYHGVLGSGEATLKVKVTGGSVSIGA